MPEKPFSSDRNERIRRSPAWAGETFTNRLPTPMMQGGGGPKMMARFFFERAERGPPGPLPSVRVDPRVLAGPVSDALRVTWLGHSTTLIELNGRRVLTDPVWSNRASPVSFSGPRRFQPVPVALDAIPIPDVVVLSHDHYDHLDKDAILALARRGARIATALGVGGRLEAWGVPTAQITELDWWDDYEAAPGLTIRAFPARHFSGRSLTDRNRTLWASWSIASGGQRLYFGGDGGFDEEAFALIGERAGGFDATMLEIGAFDPAWGAIHLGPENALKAHKLLRGKTLLPIHWGTFNLAFHAWDAPAEELLAFARDTDVRLALPRIGETVLASAPPPAMPWWRALRERAGATGDAPLVSANHPTVG